MKKPRSPREQAIALSRAAAAAQLRNHRSKVHADTKKYNRTKAKRLWQKDREALYPCLLVAN